MGCMFIVFSKVLPFGFDGWTWATWGLRSVVRGSIFRFVFRDFVFCKFGVHSFFARLLFEGFGCIKWCVPKQIQGLGQ